MVCITYQYVHASYYSACIDDYAILLTLSTYIYVHAIYLKKFKVTAALEKWYVLHTSTYMVCMHDDHLCMCMHPIY